MQPKRFAHDRSFPLSDLSESLMYYEQPEWFAHDCSFPLSDLSWLLMFHERFAHSRSFVLSDLSESLTVAHLFWAIWVIWAYEWWPNERIPSPEKKSEVYTSSRCTTVFIYIYCTVRSYTVLLVMKIKWQTLDNISAQYSSKIINFQQFQTF